MGLQAEPHVKTGRARIFVRTGVRLGSCFSPSIPTAIKHCKQAPQRMPDDHKLLEEVPWTPVKIQRNGR